MRTQAGSTPSLISYVGSYDEDTWGDIGTVARILVDKNHARIRAMKKFIAAALLLMTFASPALAFGQHYHHHHHHHHHHHV
jgi:hypothetical protein